MEILTMLPDYMWNTNTNTKIYYNGENSREQTVEFYSVYNGEFASTKRCIDMKLNEGYIVVSMSIGALDEKGSCVVGVVYRKNNTKQGAGII